MGAVSIFIVRDLILGLETSISRIDGLDAAKEGER